MKKLIFIFLTFLAFGCTYRSADEPVNKAETIPADQISIGGLLAELKGHVQNEGATNRQPLFQQQISELMDEAEKIKQDRNSLHNEFLERWETLNEAVNLKYGQLPMEDVDAWVTLNDSLLKYSVDVRFADALERVVYNQVEGQPIDENRLKSFFYARLYDRIYVNVFGSSALQYEHTTGGVVRIVQDTNYPFDGKVILKIELQDKRYLDFYVRIPEWANNASVVVKGVKYNVIPGQFTEIAKKWKNGDEIEIIIGLRPIVTERASPKAFALTYGSMFLSYLESGNGLLFFDDDDPIKYLQFVSPPDKMPTFTFSGIKDTSLVLQPLFAESPDGINRSIWINRK